MNNSTNSAGSFLHQPTPDEPREASAGDNHQATNAAREIGPVDGSMTAADVELDRLLGASSGGSAA